MRIPFDLIAAVMVITVINQLVGDHAPSLPLGHVYAAIPYWFAFWAMTWLINEWLTRRIEWRTRFGRRMTPENGQYHSVEIHSYMVLTAQVLTVAMYAAALWFLKWPQAMSGWPTWLGWPVWAKIENLKLRESAVVAMLLNISPFLIAMILAWVPRWRLMCGARSGRTPLLAYLNFEARLTFLPMVAWIALALIVDVARMLPGAYTAWLDTPGAEIVVPLAVLALLAVFGLPLFMIKFWHCEPLPDGELKDRLGKLLEKSGVKVRQILVWGKRDTGMLNACVLGPWSRFRYVLISPALVDELGMDETEAVLAHELGHARHGHLTLLFVMLVCISAVIDPLSTHLLPESWQSSPVIQALFWYGLFLVFVRVVFGAVMRSCEREADLASAELVGSPIPIVTALEKLALRSGNIREVYSWHHGSIAERVSSVLRVSADPEGSARVHAQVRTVRWVMAIVTVLAIGFQIRHARLISSDPPVPGPVQVQGRE